MFSYQEYVEIIKNIKLSGKQSTYCDVLKYNKQEFIIVRHDVEFSVKRAYQLACLEERNAIKSNYFFQLSSNAYNILSGCNLDIVNEIKSMGHEVGLHFYINGLVETDQIKQEIKNEIEIMNSKFHFPINCFSFHRPPSFVLEANIKIPGMINAYQNDFFQYVKDINTYKPVIKYLSDARHRWNYGLVPDGDTLMNNKKVQILIHPYSWTELGYDNKDNFKTLFKEKQQELLETFDSECMHFRDIKNEL